MRYRTLFLIALAVALGATLSFALLSQTPVAASSVEQQTTPVPKPKASTSTTDHSKLEALKGPFATGPDVTKACLTCHTKAAQEIMVTTHWTWEYTNPADGQTLGKKNVINNFCLSLNTNEPRCTSCHVGYGWKDNTFDFKQETSVDCLVCHDTTGLYKKLPNGAGNPAYKETEFPAGSGVIYKPIDLAKVAQNVGPTSRQTCGACHFSGGGGEAVKHGDLDSSLINATKSLDVHMAKESLNFTCSTCHTATAHKIEGSRYAMTAKDTKGIDIPGKDNGRASCESCHGLNPMKDTKLNDHVDRVACETCHIPTFAREEATKMSWDWSTAGQKDASGKIFTTKDAKGNVIYDSQKGDFVWESNVTPDYVWFNGDVIYTNFKKIDASQTVQINALQGSPNDPKARLWPVKKFDAKQPYDTGNNTLVAPHLFPTSADDSSAYWKLFDWNKAIKAGMDAVKQPYSGQYGFVASTMYWPQTHMVAPAKDSVQCQSCHTKSSTGRLAKVGGFYLPGRDSLPWIDWLGGLALMGAVLGVLGHSTLRLLGNKKGSK